MRKDIKYYWCCLILALLVALGLSLSETVAQNADKNDPVYPVIKKATPEFSNGIDNARDSVMGYFYPLSGAVVSVEGQLVKVRLETEKGVKKGMRLSVFREGEQFYHPVTNEPLGRTEDFIGRVEVKEEESVDGLYKCEIIKGSIETGDIVRITSSKIKLAFFQDRKSIWDLSEVFYNSLKDSGRFEILETYTSTFEPEHLSKLAKGLDAEAVLLFSTPVKNKKRLLNIKLYWSEDAKIFREIEKEISHDVVKMFTHDKEFFPVALADIEPWGSYDIPGGQLIAVGDVDNNGIREFVISDGNNIRIYNLKEELQELWFIKGNPEDIHLSIDILDANNNGMAEIFVTSMIDSSEIDSVGDTRKYPKNIRINSFVIEYNSSEGYKKIKNNMPYFFRVIKETLLMQKFTSDKIFSGSVYKAEWRNGNYQPEIALKLPPKLNIYGFTYVDWQNKGEIHLMTFDDEGYLNLYDENGHLIWKSSKTYGDFDLSFEKETHTILYPTVKWLIRDRLISIQTERGQEVIVVNKIPVLSRVPGLGSRGAEVYSLWWDGDIMDEKLILSEVSGTITDYWIEGEKLFLVARGDLFTFVKNALTGEFTKGSTLYYYNYNRK